MKKRDLFNLTVEVGKILDEPPLIVGSQAIFALTDEPPEIVLKSIECDFLLISNLGQLRPIITENLGIFSDYQLKTGFYADVLGKATVVLPNNWETRLVELRDNEGKVFALCVEIHDIAVSKLMAGREKDFIFLQFAFELDYLQIDTFLKRAETILQHPAANALHPRLLKLIEKFRKLSNLRQTVEGLKKLSTKIRTKQSE